MVNIKVAVRIRPFSKRELAQGDSVIVQRENKSIVVTNPKIPERQEGDSRKKIRKFVADFCYDPKDPESCSQDVVYREIGLEVLDSMFEGYNACVLAYGHSASGKTYTMMGIKDDPGLTPRICQGLFDRVSQKPYGSKTQYQIFISFLEIYNEKVRDLLADDEAIATTTNFSLRVREHPKLGPYVQDLSQHLVSDKAKLLELIEIGNKRRSTAATENNLYSSRSHAVFTILCKQTGDESDKFSKVHLVDLAGSERANAVQSKTRLKEGANINKSLVTLGNVISALAESCENLFPNKEHSAHSRTWQPFVPYRDSVLTWLLKDTLGGNSNTIMIATISPASSCLNETINTLRYAKKTKRIVNQPIINEDPKVKTIRELREEIKRLKSTLKCFQLCQKQFEPGDELSNLTKFMKPTKINSEWLDPGGTQVIVCGPAHGVLSCLNESELYFQQSNLQRLHGKKSEERNKIESDDETEESLISNILVRTGTDFEEVHENKVVICRTASVENNACKINDEKESDVNEPVLDSIAPEVQFFSDSLENSSSLSLKSKSQSDAEKSEFEESDFVKYVGSRKEDNNFLSVVKTSKSLSKSQRESKLCSKRDYDSCDNLPKMLHRSRPDLIKSIFIHSKEEFPPTSSQSCTDISNFSLSTSENSLNSSGSADMQPSESKLVRTNKSRKGLPFLLDKGVDGNGHQPPKRGKTKNSESFQTGLKKKNKRSEIVEAVTTRLYVSKRTPNNRNELMRGSEKDECEDESELEELKLCKRARMKLFDLSRKLAMTRRLKKTMDNDTQTDFQTGTIRVKEKCVLTDQSGILKFEESGTNTSSDEKPKEKIEGHTIMNQVFIPRSSNFVVQCGKNLRVEIQGETNKCNLGTQTDFDERCCANFGTSSFPQNTEWFSDDSLDLEQKTKVYKENIPEHDNKSETKFFSQENLNLSSRTQSLSFRSQESLANLEGNSQKSQEFFTQKPVLICKKNFSNEHEAELKNESLKKLYKYKNPTEAFKEIHVSTIDHQVSPVFKGNLLKEETVDRVDFSASTSTITCPLATAKEMYSSENSLTSAESIDLSSSGETSSEDFIFYERLKDKEPGSRMKMVSDRELYTITENSEQSDPSDAFSPMQKQEGFARASQTTECMSPFPKISPGNKGKDQWEEKRFENMSANEMKTSSRVEEIKRPMNIKNKEIAFCKNCQTLDLFIADRCSNDYEDSISGLGEGDSTYSLKYFDTFSHESRQRPNSSENPAKNTHQHLMVPNPGFIPAYDRVSKNFENKRNSLSKKDTEPCSSDSECRVATENGSKRNCSKAKKVNGMNVELNAKEQFLKFDILNSTKNSSFSIDTPLLSGPSKKDQSTETLFPSDDSITFVFMGPAKPETSVLMEIVRRGLNKNNSSNENANTCRESKSRGVQCDSELMRSVSVDTALFALSRIAKNQEPCVSIPRIRSLNALVGNEIQTAFNERRLQDFRESSCQCDLDTEFSKVETTNGSLQCSGYYSATQERKAERPCVKIKKPGDEEKPKKSVSWSGKPECKNNESVRSQNNQVSISTTTSSFGLDQCRLGEVKRDESDRENRPILNWSSKESAELDSGYQARRVRFSKPESIADMCHVMDHTQEAIHSSEDVPAFIKEMTQFLKHLKSLSMSYEKSIEEVTKQTEDLTNPKNTDQNNELKTSLKKNSKRYEVQKKIDQTTRKSQLAVISNENAIQEPCSLTWPRRRTTEKKPLTGNTTTRYCSLTTKSPRSPLFSRCNDSSCNAFIDFTRHSSHSNRNVSAISNLNSLSFSTAISNSCGGEGQSRSSSSRSNYSNGSRYPKDLSCSSVYSSMMTSSRPSLPLLNFDWILDLEMDLKESCRRLELATEEDRIRQKISENKRNGFSYANRDLESSFTMDNESQWIWRQNGRKNTIESKLSTRRQNGKCFEICNCRRTQMNNCRCHVSNSYCSTFELDSFGPGSKHCHQLCMFCRKKDLEKYFSTPSLNTECNLDLCRLSCYGYCPCSSIRLRNVSSSPRAYMQNLLNLRRKIVKETKSTDPNYPGRKVCSFLK